MADKKKKANDDMVTVAFGESLSEARELESLLRNNDIPAVIREQDNDDKNAEDTEGVYAIMVPEEYLDEATVIIDSNDAYEDFYEQALDEDRDFDDEEEDQDY